MKPKLPIKQTCGHVALKWCSHYPGFTWPGLSEPFILLVAICDQCARHATVDNQLTVKRWERMKHVLTEAGERVPAFEEIAFKLQSLEYERSTKYYDDAANYSYVLAA